MLIRWKGVATARNRMLRDRGSAASGAIVLVEGVRVVVGAGFVPRFPRERPGLSIAVAAIPAPEQAVGRVLEQGLGAGEFVRAVLAVLEQRAGRGGDIGGLGSGAEVGHEDREVLRGRLAEPTPQVGIIH